MSALYKSWNTVAAKLSVFKYTASEMLIKLSKICENHENIPQHAQQNKTPAHRGEGLCCRWSNLKAGHLFDHLTIWSALHGHWKCSTSGRNTMVTLLGKWTELFECSLSTTCWVHWTTIWSVLWSVLVSVLKLLMSTNHYTLQRIHPLPWKVVLYTILFLKYFFLINQF